MNECIKHSIYILCRYASVWSNYTLHGYIAAHVTLIVSALLDSGRSLHIGKVLVRQPAFRSFRTGPHAGALRAAYRTGADVAALRAAYARPTVNLIPDSSHGWITAELQQFGLS